MLAVHVLRRGTKRIIQSMYMSKRCWKVKLFQVKGFWAAQLEIMMMFSRITFVFLRNSPKNLGEIDHFGTRPANLGKRYEHVASRL